MATPSFNIEETTVESFPYISIIDSIAVESIGETLQGMYQKLGEFMAQNQLEQAGPNFAMYHTWDGKTTKMQGGVPLSEEVKGYENIVAGMSYSGNVLKLVFKGPYDDSEAAHEAIAAYAEENGKEIIGGPWEVYVVGYAQSQNPDEFVTEIYYPIN
jgi:effector-binding domain-containing protein